MSVARVAAAVCDTTVASHAGPVVTRAYRHGLHLIAEALVAVGRGVSYTRAAQRARVAAGRDPLAGDSAGQMVAEWVDVWAPVVLAALAETEQPETLVLDSTDFWWTNTRTRTRRREFAVLVAYGYTGAGQVRVWGIHASPTARTSNYLNLLRGLQLPGRPASIVTDNAHAGQGRWMRRLDTAFRREEAWKEFRSATAVLGQAAAWVRANDSQISRQGHLLPAHYSTAGAEAAAARLRGMFEQRSFALRNAARTNLLLGLARLHLNNRDDVGTYHRQLREAAEQRDGHSDLLGLGADTRTHPRAGG